MRKRPPRRRRSRCPRRYRQGLSHAGRDERVCTRTGAGDEDGGRPRKEKSEVGGSQPKKHRSVPLPTSPFLSHRFETPSPQQLDRFETESTTIRYECNHNARARAGRQGAIRAPCPSIPLGGDDATEAGRLTRVQGLRVFHDGKGPGGLLNVGGI